jgi:hypothetical protein
MAWILAPSAARARGTCRTTPSVRELIHSCAGCEQTKKIQSGLSQGKEVVESYLGFAELIAAYISFRENVLRVVQELHLGQRCKKDNYPANTDHNVALKGSLRTIRVEERRKLNYPLISFEPACESGFLQIHTPREVGSRESGGRRG